MTPTTVTIPNLNTTSITSIPTNNNNNTNNIIIPPPALLSPAHSTTSSSAKLNVNQIQQLIDQVVKNPSPAPSPAGSLSGTPIPSPRMVNALNMNAMNTTTLESVLAQQKQLQEMQTQMQTQYQQQMESIYQQQISYPVFNNNTPTTTDPFGSTNNNNNPFNSDSNSPLGIAALDSFNNNTNNTMSNNMMSNPFNSNSNNLFGSTSANNNPFYSPFSNNMSNPFGSSNNTNNPFSNNANNMMMDSTTVPINMSSKSNGQRSSQASQVATPRSTDWNLIIARIKYLHDCEHTLNEIISHENFFEAAGRFIMYIAAYNCVCSSL